MVEPLIQALLVKQVTAVDPTPNRVSLASQTDRTQDIGPLRRALDSSHHPKEIVGPNTKLGVASPAAVVEPGKTKAKHDAEEDQEGLQGVRRLLPARFMRRVDQNNTRV